MVLNYRMFSKSFQSHIKGSRRKESNKFHYQSRREEGERKKKDGGNYVRAVDIVE